jgi:Tfp pilus assembly protein PilN
MNLNLLDWREQRINKTRKLFFLQLFIFFSLIACAILALRCKIERNLQHENLFVRELKIELKSTKIKANKNKIENKMRGMDQKDLKKMHQAQDYFFVLTEGLVTLAKTAPKNIRLISLVVNNSEIQLSAQAGSGGFALDFFKNAVLNNKYFTKSSLISLSNKNGDIEVLIKAKLRCA